MNLQIIYDNLVNLSGATVSAPEASANFPASNLKLDTKGKVWKANSNNATITVGWGTSKTISGVALCFTNLTIDATIRVQGTGGTAFDTGAILARPWSNIVPWGAETFPEGSSSTYAYGGGSHARCWIPTGMRGPSTGCTITINNVGGGNIEVSRLVVGEAWSPKYNTSFGVSTGVKDLSTHERFMSGDLYTYRQPKYNTLTFDLKYMDSGDRTNFMRILRANGISKSMFVSIFPTLAATKNSEEAEKERDFQVFGRLSQLDALVHSTFEMYSSQMTIEEV